MSTPSLLLQCQGDAMVPMAVGEYMRDHLAGSTLVRMAAAGHCPHLSAPEETAAVIRRHLLTAA